MISPENTFQRHWSISRPNGQERHLFERLLEQQADVLGGVGRLLDEAELHQVLGRDRERDGVADRLVEAVVGAVAEQHRLLVVGALVEVVAQLVVDGGEVLRRGLDAHLDAQIVQVVDVPGAGVAHHFAVARLDEQRPLPEGRRQRRESRARRRSPRRSGPSAGSPSCGPSGSW